MSRARALMLAGLLALAVNPARAEPLEDLKRFYAEVTSLSARFEQRLIDEDGDTLERYEGHFWLRRPGQFLWRYEAPFPQEIGTDGQQLWHYDVDLRQVTLRPAQGSLGGTPAELLGGDAAQLDNYAFERLADAEGLEWLKLVPRSDDTDFESVNIGLSDGVPVRIDLQDRLGQLTRMQLIDLKRNPALASDLFEFKIPDGVTVVDERG